jgi:hypothetical protein
VAAVGLGVLAAAAVGWSILAAASSRCYSGNLFFKDWFTVSLGFHEFVFAHNPCIVDFNLIFFLYIQSYEKVFHLKLA